MKDYIVPYIIGKHEGWWAGIDIYNHNPDEHTISISIYQHNNGKRSGVFDIKIDSFGHYLIMPDKINDYIKNVTENEGRSTVIVRGPENLMITPFQGSDSHGFGILPVFESTSIKN